MIFAGIDVGSVATKVLLLQSQPSGSPTVLIRKCSSTVPDMAAGAEDLLTEALAGAGLAHNEIEHTVSTGYGRRVVTVESEIITEITACARGGWYLGTSSGRLRTIIDLGGQDTKVILLGDSGRVSDFAMNDKCAAGTGKFLEIVASALQISITDMATLAEQASNRIQLNSTCTVFAESEVISLLARGTTKEDIIAAVHTSLCERMVSLVKTVGGRPPFLFVGGGALNKGLFEELKKQLHEDIYRPENPQFVVSLGAALIAAESH